MRQAVWVGAVAVLVSGGAALGQERKPDIIAKLDGHLGGVSALAFNPKVSYLATGAGNGVVRVWEAKSGELAVRMNPQKTSGGRIQHLHFSSGFGGFLLSSSSRNSVMVWNLVPPLPPKKDMMPPDPKDPKLPDIKKEEPGPRKGLNPTPPIIFEDGLGFDALKIGTLTGDGKRVYYSTTEGVRVGVNSQVLLGDFGETTTDEFKGIFTPLAVDAIPGTESSLVALYGTVKAADRSEQPVIALVGLGDGRYVGRNAVRAPIADRPTTVKFSPDGKMLVACNGEDVMFWRVPSSQVIEGDPKILTGSPAYAAVPGPNGLVALASPPEAGKKVKVTILDLSSNEPKVVAVYSTDIDRVSALAYSPDGTILAVADDTEGVVQLWELGGKK